MSIFTDIDALCCSPLSAEIREILAWKLEQVRLLSMSGAVRYDLFLRIEELVRAILAA